MSNVSVADILKMHGDWIESNKFIELVREKLKISDRQAYRLIKKDKQILRLTLQDRTVLYGLAEFGLPKFEEKPSTEKLNTVKTALEHGILTKEDLELIANIDFFLQNPELIGIDNSEESKSIKDVLKLVKNFHLQKIESLKNIGADSE